MKQLHDIRRYNEAKKKIEELEPLIEALDDVCDILYNNLGNSGMFRLLEQAEDVRISYYLQHYEHQQVLKNKGKVIYG